ncbi:MAG: hypothetical protein HY744_32135 [Deltaproteobacteria bacterium]|nr:hypothetical protein [Deltaproteobacteria bacterium]
MRRIIALALAYAAAGCAPAQRTIIFDAFAPTEHAARAVVPGRLSLDKPTLRIDSTCAQKCIWSDAERIAAENHIRDELLRLLGPQNTSLSPEGARYAVHVDVIVNEKLHGNGLIALQIILPLALGAGAGVTAYMLTPAPPECPPDMFCVAQTDNRFSNALTSAAISMSLWTLVFATLPSRTGEYQAAAAVKVLDRATGQVVLNETVAVSLEDTFSTYAGQDKIDRLTGEVLRQLSVRVAELLAQPAQRAPALAARPPSAPR